MERQAVRVQAQEIAEVWGIEFSDWMLDRISLLNLEYEELTDSERDEAIITVLKTLDSDLVSSGPHRIGSWESGWGENKRAFRETGSASALTPGYFGKHPLLRWNRRWIRSRNPAMEYEMLGLLLDWVFDTRIGDVKHLYEFGCGTGHNLVRARQRHPDAALWGLDWAESSQAVIDEYNRRSGDWIYARRFDFFNPDIEFRLERDATVITVASLEQTGSQFTDFISYLVDQPIERVVHIEPMSELLDPENLLDYLSIRYCKKRNYLTGLVDHLRVLEAQGRIEILEERRTYIGSFFIDGYSMVVWRPC